MKMKISTHLPRIAAPPGLDSNLMDAVAKSVTQVRSSDFVDSSVLWALSNQQMLFPEVALFIIDTSRQLAIDDGENLLMRTTDSHLASWTTFQLSLIPPTSFKYTRLDIE